VPGVTTPKQPPKPKFDGNLQFERDVRSILNKVTPQMYDKLLQQLEKLELNNAERLEGMISVIFTKAVEAAIFCSLYADICKHFKKIQVTVPDTNGQPVTHYFRQILLQRCQKEFESDYRQEIGYEKRQAEVDAITDDKTRKEAEEQLQEDLLKAKRKKLGNIMYVNIRLYKSLIFLFSFIGELFKLEMLTDSIMYACIEYLLRDKTDEESLECLYRLLRTIGKELDAKAGGEKVGFIIHL
jgi:translation initiation factor 4G